eukprot:scaffold98849_cov61-Phaeocystis_antarctica.AAC.3
MTPILRRTASSAEQAAEQRLNQMYVSNWKTSQGTAHHLLVGVVPAGAPAVSLAEAAPLPLGGELRAEQRSEGLLRDRPVVQLEVELAVLDLDEGEWVDEQPLQRPPERQDQAVVAEAPEDGVGQPRVEGHAQLRVAADVLRVLLAPERAHAVARPGVHEARAEEESHVRDGDHRIYGRRPFRPEGVLHSVADGQQREARGDDQVLGGARRVADVRVDELAHDLEGGMRDADRRDGVPRGRKALVRAARAEAEREAEVEGD